MPALDVLYSESNDCADLIDIKWKIFGSITSLDDREISAIKQLPREFRMISTILFVLIKVK